MKKSSKILGSIAVSAALCMGTAVPAFADVDAASPAAPDISSSDTQTKDKINATGGGEVVDTGTTTDNSSFKGVTGVQNGASTIVNVSTYTSQISVTVPLALPIALDTAGGPGVAPTGYYIQNNSTIPVKVTKADYAIAESQKAAWTFGVSAFGTNPSSTSITTTEDATPAAPTMGSMYVSLVPTTPDAGVTPTTIELKKDPSSQHGSVASVDGWTIKGKDDANAGVNKMEITVSASSSTLKGSLNTPTTAAGIVYTVAKA